MSKSGSDGASFITEVTDLQGASTVSSSNIDRVGKPFGENGLLDQCRKENIKVKEVVNAFRSKIDNLIDKQRNEYISAYENHMQDVQKELYTLRELVTEIANNSTKKEKTSRLKDEGKHFKADALSLLAASDDLRQHIRALVKKTYKIEKSRDWLLEKLRSAKREYNMLNKEKSRLFNTIDEENMSLSQNSQGMTDMMSQSVASNYTMELEMMMEKKKKKKKKLPPSKSFTGPKKGGLEGSNSHILLPDIKSIAPPALPTKTPDPTTLINSYLLPIVGDEDDEVPSSSPPKAEQGAHRASKSLLISGRRRREEIRDFLKLCAKSLHKGPWNRVHKRSLHDVVSICNAMVHKRVMTKEDFECNTDVLKLACELAAFPETYSAILDVIDHVKMKSRPAGRDEQSECSDETDDTRDPRVALSMKKGGSDDVTPIGTGRGSGPGSRKGTGRGQAGYMGMPGDLDWGFDINHLAPPRGITSPPRSPSSQADVTAFKSKVEDIMQSSGSRSVHNIPTRKLHILSRERSAGKEDSVRGGSSKQMDRDKEQLMLQIEPDLLEYLKQEKTNKTLQSYGYFDEDDFLHFS